MFIRRVKTRTTENGSCYYSFRLVDSYRVAGRVRQRTLLNLGSHFTYPREQWPELTQRIERILQGHPELLEPDSVEQEEQAQAIVSLLLRKHSHAELLGFSGAKEGNKEQGDTNPREEGRDLHSVDLNSLEQIDSRTVGAEALALSALLEVHLAEQLNTLGFNRNQVQAAIGNIIGRMVMPSSELSTHQWLQKNTALGELLNFEYEKQGLSALYRASDLLWSHHKEIEDFLYKQHLSLFDVEESITLYDLTNTFFEGSGKFNELAAYGHSKERRNDCPLVTLALVLDGSGFVKRSRILPGNASEPATLQQMIEQLRTPHEAGDKEQGNNKDCEKNLTLDLRSPLTIVMDAGIASQENVQWLQEQGYKYIVVSRKRHMEFDEKHSIVVKEHENDSVRAMRVDSENGEVELYCHSHRKEAKEEAMAQRVSSRLEAELQHLAEGLHQPRRLKNAKKVSEKIGRLRQKYSRASRYYDITIDTDDSQKIATALRVQRVEPKNDDPNAHPGVYCLRSNQTQWDEQKLWSTYTMLTDLEAVFRSLKSELGMRPVYHQKTHRVEGHIFITLLGYNLVHQLRCKLKEQGIDDSWETIRTTMGTQMRVTASLRGEMGEQIHIRKSCRPNADQQRLLRALNLEWLPGKTEKVIVAP
jgi:transposase